MRVLPILVLLLSWTYSAAFAEEFDRAMSPCPDPLKISGGEWAELVGAVERSLAWGPPNFGEDPANDQRIDIWTISLAKPLRVTDPQSPSQMVTTNKIQIVRLRNIAGHVDIAAFESQRVAVQGKLWRASSSGDQTPVVLSPEAIELSDSEPTFRCAKSKG